MALEQKSATAIVEQPYNSTDFQGPSNLSPTHSNAGNGRPRSFDVVEPPAQLSTTTFHVHDSTPHDIFPDGGTRSWVVVLGSFFLLMSSYGMMNSTGVLQSYFASHQLSDYTSSVIGWIPGLFVFCGLGLGAQIGPMFDRYGPTGILIAGTACYVAGLLLMAECQLYWQFILTFGVLTGMGAALLSTAAISAVPHWFDRRVGFAMGTAMAGAGLGGVVFPWVLRAGFNDLGYKWTIRLLALIVGTLCAMGIAFVRSRLPRSQSKPSINVRAFQDARFTWLTMGTFIMELEVFGCLGLYPTYVVMQGFGTTTSIILLSILNVFSTIGRLVAGGVADKYGRINTQIGLLGLGAMTVFVIWLPFGNKLAGLYMFSCLYGFASGSFISLAPACIGQISKASEVGGRFGVCYLTVSFATLISIPIGGEMIETVGKQAMVAFLGAVLVIAMGMFSMARWSCLNYRWRWQAKI